MVIIDVIDGFIESWDDVLEECPKKEFEELDKKSQKLIRLNLLMNYM
jgi:hypothetical protein